jgi:hypothetical protein
MIRFLKSARWVRATVKLGRNERVFGIARYAYGSERTFLFVWGQKARGWQWVA